MIPVFRSLDSLLVLGGTEIVRRERTNKSSVHLYNVGNWWVAFERSAYLLSRLYPDGYVSVLRMKKNGEKPLIMEGISKPELSALCQSHTVLHSDDDYMVVSAETCDSLLYAEWRKGLLVLEA